MSVEVDWGVSPLDRVPVSLRREFLAAANAYAEKLERAFEEKLKDEEFAVEHEAKYERLFAKKKLRTGNSPKVSCRCCGAKDKELFLHRKHCFTDLYNLRVGDVKLYCGDCENSDEVLKERLHAALAAFFMMVRAEGGFRTVDEIAAERQKYRKAVKTDEARVGRVKGVWNGQAASRKKVPEPMEVLAASIGDGGKRYGSYQEYLDSAEWKKKRTGALKRAGFACQVCNAADKILDVHHRTYERIYRERKADLTVLCRDCHTRFHLAESGEVRRGGRVDGG